LNLGFEFLEEVRAAYQRILDGLSRVIAAGQTFQVVSITHRITGGLDE
jgi:hypothetical protein